MLYALLFIVSGLVGFRMADIFAGETVGAQGILPSIFIPIGDHYFHLHHWLYSLILIAIVLVLAIPKRSFFRHHPAYTILTIGVLSGIVAQGILRYDDWWMLWTSCRERAWSPVGLHFIFTCP